MDICPEISTFPKYPDAFIFQNWTAPSFHLVFFFRIISEKETRQHILELRKSYIVYIITYLSKRDRKHTHTHKPQQTRIQPECRSFEWNVNWVFFSVVILDVCPSWRLTCKLGPFKLVSRHNYIIKNARNAFCVHCCEWIQIKTGNKKSTMKVHDKLHV